MEETVIFRPGKRRKVNTARHFSTDDGDNQVNIQDTADAFSRSDSDEVHGGDQTALGTLLKARQKNRSRGTGVVFTNPRTTIPSTEAEEVRDPTTADDTEAITKLHDISNRFVGSSGHVVNVDRRMMEYVDSELGKKYQTQAQFPSSFYDPPTPSINTPTAHLKHENLDSSHNHPPTTKPSESQTQTGLHEVDLGHSITETNLARTQKALARVQAGQTPLEEEIRAPRRRRIRIGRDGKPMKARPPRKRDNSEELARDALVEEVLRQHALGLYDQSSRKSQTIGTPDASALETGKPMDPRSRSQDPNQNTPQTLKDQAEEEEPQEEVDHDEILASRFRQDFLDAVADRQQQRKTPTTTQTKRDGVPGNADARGPKLGGSRSARAKMAQYMASLQEGKGKK